MTTYSLSTFGPFTLAHLFIYASINLTSFPVSVPSSKIAKVRSLRPRLPRGRGPLLQVSRDRSPGQELYPRGGHLLQLQQGRGRFLYFKKSTIQRVLGSLRYIDAWSRSVVCWFHATLIIDLSVHCFMFFLPRSATS